jgi:hypothetical protein
MRTENRGQRSVFLLLACNSELLIPKSIES